VLVSQALRAFAYGLGSVLLGSTLVERRFTTTAVGLVLGAVVAGIVIAQLVVARWADRFGRRRVYGVLYVALAVTGVTLATAAPLWLLVLVALTGALSTEVVESGPFTSLELAMLSGRLDSNALVTGFGWYNAIAAGVGALGALAATLPQMVRNVWEAAPPDRIWFLFFLPVTATGVMIARRLTARVEAPTGGATTTPLGPSRPAVIRLSGLFALDAFAGGFVVQTFIAYWLIDRLGATTGTVGVLFAAIGIVQTLSFLAAPLLARRFGLLNTMVFTHLPSNLFLAAVAFAPTLSVAAALLVTRAVLSQMDVPTRQAYVAILVHPEERTAAIAYTNTARYLVRPIGPLAAGATLAFATGAPFLIAGAIKIVYDLTLWRWFRSIPLPGSLARVDPPPGRDEGGR
jgi:MFS family permease